jgi:CheY-like chemotaxis protein
MCHRPLSILIADSSFEDRRAIEEFLDDTQHQLHFASNGKEAVERLRSGRFDLVLVDVQLPVMDGYATAHAIREADVLKKGRPVPVISLSKESLSKEIMAAERQQSLSAGCVDHLSKPLSRSALRASIRSHARCSTCEAPETCGTNLPLLGRLPSVSKLTLVQ